MAGSSVTVTVSPTQYQVYRGGAKEVIVSLACLSDDTDGSIPNQDLSSVEGLSGLKAYELREVITNPVAVVYPTTAYRIKIIDKTTSRKLFIGIARSAAGLSETQGGHEHLGFYPPVDGDWTVSFIADDGATEAAADVGNEKQLTLKLRFVQRNAGL